jgi:hypothetical protein
VSERVHLPRNCQLDSWNRVKHRRRIRRPESDRTIRQRARRRRYWPRHRQSVDRSLQTIRAHRTRPLESGRQLHQCPQPPKSCRQFRLIQPEHFERRFRQNLSSPRVRLRRQPYRPSLPPPRFLGEVISFSCRGGACSARPKHKFGISARSQIHQQEFFFLCGDNVAVAVARRHHASASSFTNFLPCASVPTANKTASVRIVTISNPASAHLYPT